MGRAVSISELYNIKFKTLGFTGKWLDSFGDPEMRGSWIIWGNSANGKTSFALQLAKYLANFGRVAYNSLEEGVSLSMREAFKNVGMEAVKRKVILLEKEPISDLIERLKKQKSPHVIVIDSVQYTGMKYADYIKIIELFPKKLFILVSHADGKEPSGRVAKQIRFDAFVKIWIEGYTAYPQSRYGGGKPYTIWEEGSELYNNNY